MTNAVGPPEHVKLFYRKSGQTHVFTSREVQGLYIGDLDLRTAFEKAFTAVGRHYSNQCAEHVEYEPSITFNKFEAKVHANRLTAEYGIPVEGGLAHRVLHPVD